MTNRTAAGRYARALLDVAVAEKVDVRRVEAELAELVDLFRRYPPLEKVLLNPAVPAPRKRAAVAELTARVGVLSVVSKLLVLLAERDRLVLLPELLAAYRERLLDHLNVVRAEVTTAVPLTMDRSRAVERSLSQLTGRTVTLATRVDPSIVGGVVARIGSTIYDGSVARQLEKIRVTLAGRA